MEVLEEFVQVWEEQPLCRPIFPVLVKEHLIRRTARRPSLPENRIRRPAGCDFRVTESISGSSARYWNVPRIVRYAWCALFGFQRTVRTGIWRMQPHLPVAR
jgi:hypothetical protein